ncbi:MAG: hypothetical protein AAGF48_15295 [Pseudomonadota bacterium]
MFAQIRESIRRLTRQDYDDITFEAVEVSLDEAERAAHQSAAYLVSQAKADGSFLYRRNLNPSVYVRPRYNWLRHAGTLYALAEYYERYGGEDVLAVIANGVECMRRDCLVPLPKFPGCLAVWTRPDAQVTEELECAKLGGAGLALVAMSRLARLNPNLVNMEEQRGLARFILAMQKPDGSFYSKYIPSTGGLSDTWTSLYYPGEAALGLVSLYQLDNDALWVKAARNALIFLAKSRAGSKRVPADHWALIATEEVWTFLSDQDRQELRTHARQIVEAILLDQVWQSNSPFHGSFVEDGRTTPNATRLEGLLAAEFLFRDEPPFHRSLRSCMNRAMRFALNARYSKGQETGAVPRAIGQIGGDDPKTRSFNRRASEIRIDYVQHSLSAYLKWARFLKRRMLWRPIAKNKL